MAASKKLPLSFLSAARSLGSQPLSFALRRPSPLLRPLLSSAEFSLRLLSSSPSSGGLRSFSSRPTTSSLNDPSPNWSNRPPKETILLDGCDFEHWLVVMEPPDPSHTRDEIIDYYIKTLAQVLGSEEEARMSIYSVSTKHYFAFGAKVSEETSYKIKPLPKVRWVLPDSYLDVKNKDFGGEPFIDGKAVPYDPKYHEEWVRNNQRANERSKRNDRPRNFDRSRNFERRRENRDAAPMSNFQNPMPPREMPPNSGPEPGYNQMPNPQSNYAPNPGPGYQGNAQGYHGGPATNGPSYNGGGSGYSGGNSGYQAGIPSGNVTTGGPSYHGGNPADQTGNNGHQGGNPSVSVVGGVNPNQGARPGYQGGFPANQGARPGYQGGFPANQGARPGYQGGFPPNQGGNPATQAGNTEYPGGNRGNNMTGGLSYHGGSSGYQGQNGSYQGGNPGYHGGGPDYHGSRPGHQGGTLNFRDGS